MKKQTKKQEKKVRDEYKLGLINLKSEQCIYNTKH